MVVLALAALSPGPGAWAHNGTLLNRHRLRSCSLATAAGRASVPPQPGQRRTTLPGQPSDAHQRVADAGQATGGGSLSRTLLVQPRVGFLIRSWTLLPIRLRQGGVGH
jgi:hypothetical protein